MQHVARQIWNRLRFSWADPSPTQTGRLTVKKLQHLDQPLLRQTGKNDRIHYSRPLRCSVQMRIRSTSPRFTSIKWKYNVSISACYVCLVLYVCHSAFYVGGRSRSGHLTSTRPDRQPAPVDPTSFHLCRARSLATADFDTYLTIRGLVWRSGFVVVLGSRAGMFDFRSGCGCVKTVGKLFTPLCICHQAIWFGASQRAVTLCG